MVREGDPTDTVDVPHDGTVEDALEIFFRAQGSQEDRSHWSVKALGDDSKLLDVCPETMPAANCRHVALLREGG